MAVLTMRQIASYAYSAGFRSNALITATAVAMAESGGNTMVVNRLGCTGLMQIYIKQHIKAHPSWSTKAMQQPYNNMKAAYILSNSGTNWRPWAAYANGSYRKYLTSARAAAQQTIAAKANGGSTPNKTSNPSGPTAAKALQIAASQIGYRERGNNRTKYHPDMGLGYGQPWCACFTSWVLWKAGFSKAELKSMLGSNLFLVYGIMNHIKKRGMWKSSPRPGDLAIFTYSHIEIVEKVLSNGKIQTIGGNTTSGSRGSQNNGDGVWRKVRDRKSIRGFVRIPYDSGGSGSNTRGIDGMDLGGMDAGPKPDIDERGVLNENGVWNTATVTELARDLGITLPLTSTAAFWRAVETKAGFPPNYVNGKVDTETVQWVQWYTNQTVNGVWNTRCILNIQKYLNGRKK